ncbi:MAG: hypothetical protein K0B52_04040 [FCB group bacterium]|nr:hypothetical protein [FCB group bacterium]
MKFWPFVLRCLTVGAITFVTGIIVFFLYKLILYGDVAWAWGEMFRLGVILGIVLPLTDLIKAPKA